MPEYDLNILPPFVYPFSSQQEETKRYLGARTLVGDEYATLNILMANDVEASALYNFWKLDCEYGTLSFTLPIPQFGFDYDPTEADVTARFIGNIIMERQGTHWTSNMRIKILAIDSLFPSATLYPSTTLYPS